MYRKLILFIFVLMSMFFITDSVEVKALDNSYEVNYRLADDEDSCDAIFDKEVIDFLQQIFNLFKYAAPLLCLVLSVFDFIKATASQDKDAVIKAAKTTGKRVIYAIILFLIPTVLNFVFELLGWYGTCGIS